MNYLRMRRELLGPVDLAPLPAGLALRPFDPPIAPACRGLLDRAYVEAGHAPLPFEQWYPPLIADSEYDPALIWVAMADDQVAGFCQCWSGNFIKDVAVDKHWRRHGLGAALVTRALRAFAAGGAGYVDLKTDSDNVKAQSLYRRLGFEIVERVG